MERVFSSNWQQFIFAGFIVCDSKAMAYPVLKFFCVSVAPRPDFEASHLVLVKYNLSFPGNPEVQFLMLDLGFPKSTFRRSGNIPSLLNQCPKYMMVLETKTHFKLVLVLIF